MQISRAMSARVVTAATLCFAGLSANAQQSELASCLDRNPAGSYECAYRPHIVPPWSIWIAGPVQIRGANARGDFFLPFATTEGTLVASFQHAFNVINRAGGAAALVSEEQVGRAPCFEFADVHEAGAFARWLPSQRDGLAAAVATTSRYCRLIGLHTSILGNTVYVRFEFTTGDAAGQNMVTLATQVGCLWLLERMPAKPRSWLVESVLSGDKRGLEATLEYFGELGARTDGTFRLELEQVFANDSTAVGIHRETARRGGKALKTRCVIIFALSNERVTRAWVHYEDQTVVDAFFA